MKKLLSVLAVAGMILLGSVPVGAAESRMWGTGSPTGNDVDASGPSPVIFKFHLSDGSLIGSTFSYEALNWLQIKGIADSGSYLYVSHDTWTGSPMATHDFKIAKVRMDNGAVLSDTSIAGYIAGQTYSQVNALRFLNGRLFGVENSASGTVPGRGYAVEILLDANGDVTGAAQGAYISLLPTGALAFYDGYWYAASKGYAPDALTEGSSIYKSAGPDIMAITTTFAKEGGTESDNRAVVDTASQGIGFIAGWEFDGAGTLFAVTGASPRAVYSVNLISQQATKLYDLPMALLTAFPDLTTLDGLSNAVPDTTAPVVTVPADITVQSAGGPVVVTFTASAVDNVDGEITPVCVPASGSSFPMGTTAVTCTATDAGGNVGTGSFNVVVEPDITAPVVIVPTGIYRLSAGTVTFTATAVDNVDGAITPVCVPASGSTFALGTTTVTCTATDASGNVGAASFPVVVGAAGKPVGVWAKEGDGSATVYFNAPANNGGEEITGYIVTSSPGGITATGAASPITVTGLSNDTAYTFTVRAVNSRGVGQESLPSNSVTPKALVPEVPGIWAKEGDASATLTISRPWPGGPVTIGGQTPTISHFEVTIQPGNITRMVACTGLSTEFLWDGLTNGTTYTFTARAVNSLNRTSADSTPSNSVTPTTAAVAPVAPGIWVKEGDGSATIYINRPWTPGAPAVTISSYTVTIYPGGTTISIPCTGEVTPFTWVGLTNETAYTFTATAVNSMNKTSPASIPSNSVTPTPAVEAPVAPGIWAKEGNATATLTISRPWTPGAPDVTITNYLVTVHPGDVTKTVSCTGLSTVYNWPDPLTNGTPYTFTARAVNSAGKISPESEPSNSVTPMLLLPAAPSGVWAVAGDGQATISFVAPWNRDLVPAITGYVFKRYPDGATFLRSGASALPYTWTGLDNGTAYTFTVTARNAWGDGPESEPSNMIISAAVVPEAPGLWATAGDTSATLTINSPYPGGPAVTVDSYTITVSPDGGSVISSPRNIVSAGATTTYTWPGLTNDKTYVFTVTATNSAMKTGPASEPVSVTPKAVVPEAPAISAQAGDGTAEITISRPLFTGGPTVTILSYIVTASVYGGSVVGSSDPIPCTGAVMTYTYPGLNNGTAYVFTAKAINDAGGTSVDSEPSNSVTPMPAVPGVPSNVRVTPGDKIATVTFSAPWNASQVPAITGYTVTCSPGPFVASGPASPIVVPGLTNETIYTCTVHATNSRGSGPESEPMTVTPQAEVAPEAPGVWAATGDTRATLTINEPYAGGPALTISGYTITINPGGTTIPISSDGAITTFTWPGLTNGTPYTFTVTAINSAGKMGPASTVGVTPTATEVAPEAPSVAATAGDERAFLTIDRPLYPGGTGLTITSYVVTAHLQGGAIVGSLTVPCSGEHTTYTWTGLTNGTTYYFTAKAINDVGGISVESSVNDADSLVTPAYAVPGAPSNVMAAPGDGSITVTFGAPWNAADVPVITSYTVTCSPDGHTATGAASPITIEHLTNGVPYTCTVHATNSRGTGPESNETPVVTPEAEPEY